MNFVDASHNIKFNMDVTTKWYQDFAKSNKDLTGYQEVSTDRGRAAVLLNAQKNGRGLYHPAGTANPISWNKAVFKNLAGESSVIEVHAGAQAMGVPIKHHPARDIVKVGLQHIASGQKVLRYNVHPTPGATSPESTNPDFNAAAHAWKDWSIAQYWLDVVADVAKEISRNGVGGRVAFWDVILIGGDYNADLVTQYNDQWYYPSRMLPSLFVQDTIPKGLDHMQQTKHSDVRLVRRWSVVGNTDHRIHFAERAFKEMADFPPTK